MEVYSCGKQSSNSPPIRYRILHHDVACPLCIKTLNLKHMISAGQAAIYSLRDILNLLEIHCDKSIIERVFPNFVYEGFAYTHNALIY